MKFAILMMMMVLFTSAKRYVPYPNCDYCETYHNMEDSGAEWGIGPDQWAEHYRIWHDTPEGGQRFTPNTSDEEDYVDIAGEDDVDDPQPEMVLLPDDQEEFVAGAGDHVHSTPINSPPHSPEVIEIVAVDENRPQPSNRRPATHHPPLGPAKTPSRKRPASQNPTSSKRPKVCFKKDQNSRPIILQDPAIVEAGPSSRDPSAPAPSGANPGSSQPFIGEAGPSGMQNRGKSGRLGKGKAKNPNFKGKRKEESKESKNKKIIKKHKQGKITDLKMRRMGYIRNCELSFKTTYVGGIPQVEILCNTDYGLLSVAQYRQIYCGENGEWEEDDDEEEEEEEEEQQQQESVEEIHETTMTPILAHDLHQRISSSTPRPGPLGGRNILTMTADVSEGAVFHSCAKMMSMKRRKRSLSSKRRKRALPLLFGGLLTIIIASVATQQTIVDKMVNPECPHGYIKFAHRCIKEQPEKCPIGMINVLFFNNTIVE